MRQLINNKTSRSQLASSVASFLFLFPCPLTAFFVSADKLAKYKTAASFLVRGVHLFINPKLVFHYGLLAEGFDLSAIQVDDSDDSDEDTDSENDRDDDGEQ